MISLLAATLAASLGAGPTPTAVEHTQTRVVTMPASVSESAPFSVAESEPAPPEAVGSTSGVEGSGSGSFVSRRDENVEYWKIDEAPGD